mmetsp:Transcript_39014/g.112051  ORF Transcript_39014/g.112051 Transcript_39014/m.112051 type:complete len:250 (-) Transcript_39014:619-1368(-)
MSSVRRRAWPRSSARASPAIGKLRWRARGLVARPRAAGTAPRNPARSSTSPLPRRARQRPRRSPPPPRWWIEPPLWWLRRRRSRPVKRCRGTAVRGDGHRPTTPCCGRRWAPCGRARRTSGDRLRRWWASRRRSAGPEPSAAVDATKAARLHPELGGGGGGWNAHQRMRLPAKPTTCSAASCRSVTAPCVRGSSAHSSAGAALAPVATSLRCRAAPSLWPPPRRCLRYRRQAWTPRLCLWPMWQTTRPT